MSKLINFFLYIGLSTLIMSCSGKEKTPNHVTFENGEANKERPTLMKVEINYEDMYTTTFTSITCKEFENTFSEVIKKKTLLTSHISKLENLINKTLSDNIETESIDVRVKARLFYSNSSVKEVCFGLHSLQYEGITYSISKEFREYLLEVTETKPSD